MKGAELPFNFIVGTVIIIIAAVMYFIFLRTGIYGGMTDADAFNTGCQKLQTDFNCNYISVSNIKIDGYDPDKDGVPNTLFDACKNTIKNSLTKKECAKYCGCNSAARTGLGIDENAGVIGSSGVVYT